MKKKIALIFCAIALTFNVHGVVSVETYLDMCKPIKKDEYSSECKAFMAGMDQGLIFGALFGTNKLARMVDDEGFREKIINEGGSVELLVRELSSKNLTTMLGFCQTFGVSMSQYAKDLNKFIKKEKIDSSATIFAVYKELLSKKYPLKGCKDKGLKD